MEDELLNEFISESREHLATIETDLLAIEDAGASVEETLVNKVFRAAHSIKGGSGFFGLTKVKELAHRAETVLDMLRSRKMVPNAEITNVLLAAFDKLREMINDTANQESADIADLLVSLNGLASSYLPTGEKASLTQNVALHAPGDEQHVVTVPQVDFERAKRSGQHVYCVELDLIHDIDKTGKSVLGVFRDIWESGEILDCALDFDAIGTLDGPVGHKLPLRLIFATVIGPGDIGVLVEVAPEKMKVLFDPNQNIPPPEIIPAYPPTPSAYLVPPAPSEPQPPSVAVTAPAPAPTLSAPAPAPTLANPEPGQAVPTGEARPVASGGELTLRVNVGLLESLMNLAGELVLSRNQLRAAIAQNDDRALTIADQRINQVTAELQDAIMQTRLQPIGSVFGKFPRVVRDIAKILGKDVNLEINGRDVAMDKSLIEGLSDPLTHMVRNAVDHGLELPEERIRIGKNAQGTVRLEARHEAGQVIVEIADDGKGLDPRKLGQAAVSKGLMSTEKVATLTDQELYNIIFLPGFSTAAKVTDVSGRGVGMDVVKTNLDRMGGKIEIHSIIGQGTLFRIKLPLTLAIMPSLIVSVGEERFAIPQVNVEELLHIAAADVPQRIDLIGDAEVLLLREQILPLLRFSELLGLPKARQEVGALNIAVVITGNMRYGLAVEDFHDTEEIVVKPLGHHLQGLQEYAGATILGDGAVALILDIVGLAAKAELVAVARSVASQAASRTSLAEKAVNSQSLLLFHNGPEVLCATPLETVLRVERIKPEQVEIIGGKRTMQYRGAMLPLVTLSDVAEVKPIGDSTDLAVIVSSIRGREVGLLGSMPVDVIETSATLDLATHRQRGVAGSAIINSRIALIADMVELVDSVTGAEAPPQTVNALPAPRSSDRRLAILLAEDSDFFRAQVKRYLEEDGEVVLDAPDGESAWQMLLEHLDEIQAVITDIEMPRLTGLGLAQRIRSDNRTSRLPIVGLSSCAGEDDINRGKAAGLDDYLVKLDRDELLTWVRAHVAQPAGS